VAAGANGSKPHLSLTLLDLSDRELLLILRDVGDGPEGWAEAVDVAERLKIDGEPPIRSVSVRFSWLKRFGAVEREAERDEKGNIRVTRGGKTRHTQRWRLTEIGLAMATGTLKKAQEKTFDGLSDAQMLVATRWLTKRVMGSDPTVGKLMDREYRYGVGRR
jgi:hypothetical protein